MDRLEVELENRGWGRVGWGGVGGGAICYRSVLRISD